MLAPAVIDSAVCSWYEGLAYLGGILAEETKHTISTAKRALKVLSVIFLFLVVTIGTVLFLLANVDEDNGPEIWRGLNREQIAEINGIEAIYVGVDNSYGAPLECVVALQPRKGFEPKMTFACFPQTAVFNLFDVPYAPVPGERMLIFVIGTDQFAMQPLGKGG